MDDVKPFHNFNQVLHLGCSNDYCAQCTCAEGIQLVRVCICMCVYLCVCMSRLCYSDFLKVAKNQALMNAVQAQHGNTSNIIVFNFWIKALFINFMAWFAYLKHRCGLQLGSIQQEQLLTVELHSKQAILANWNICYFVHSVTMWVCVVKHTLSLIYSWYKDLSLVNESTTCIIVSTKQTCKCHS